VIGRRARGVRVPRANDALPALDREPERLQQALQHGIGLKAIAAAQNALDQRERVQWLRLAQLHREIFVRDV
jgi:hypothetical protein